ncbi:AER417Wp [Eremothecium gossypii ATCC 10895]|uniref:AER417Wp n=1 Tax=Eremothecium gossypii (strain ATCC 10895 / CBS 109.51 / FGSC 9923 / NRRL Y-1056) TaxID=284811 RepID=Q755V1_EREGS|nr:AER417Wp [Eremothecium gossypii ATCC 10895]AAS53096.1 AER417Wp [Eremothecium gossypii ATCC 10895]AEY97405.1 FAER417Wp [Eremothecium gossypii FDAG1]
MQCVRILLIARLLVLVRGLLTEAYPISKQFPAVARVGQEFQFELSENTFQSDKGSSKVQYAVSGQPKWLNWDGSRRLLYGTATREYVGAEGTRFFDIVVEGTDVGDGTTLQQKYRLVATSRMAPRLAPGFDILNVLKQSGNTDGRNSLKVLPGESLNVVIPKQMFVAGSEESPVVAYYGLTQRFHAPLPSWLFFDSSQLRFSGTPPVVNSNTAPEVPYSLTIIATDFEGFTGVEVPFGVVVSAQKLTTTITSPLVINVTDQGVLDYELPLNYILLNGKPITEAELSTITLHDNPKWVKNSGSKLYGKLSEPATANFTVSVKDIYGNTIYLTITIESTERLFTVSELPVVMATRNSWFQYDLSPSVFLRSSSFDVSVSYSGADWLHFTKSNLTFQGVVPKDFSELSVEITAKGATKSETLPLKFSGRSKVQPSTSTTRSSSTSSPSETSTGHSSTITSTTTAIDTATTSDAATSATSSVGEPVSENKKSDRDLKRLVAIVCGIVIPLAVILAVLLLLFLLWRRRQSKKSEAKDPEYSTKHISSPKLGNPANRPNMFASKSRRKEANANPFADPPASQSEAKKMAALNALHFDEHSSDTSLVNEKDEFEEKADDDSVLSVDAMDRIAAAEHGLPRSDSVYITTDPKSASVYYNSEPSQRRSWRYSAHMSKRNSAQRAAPSASRRESHGSLKTVSTAELLNTEVTTHSNIPHDPSKSTLGPRDSVFLSGTGKPISDASTGKYTLPPLTETKYKSGLSADSNESKRASDSSGGSDFIPVKQGDTYQFTPKRSTDSRFGKTAPMRKQSTKRLVNLPNRGGVNVSDASLIGQEPERD